MGVHPFVFIKNSDDLIHILRVTIVWGEADFIVDHFEQHGMLPTVCLSVWNKVLVRVFGIFLIARIIIIVVAVLLAKLAYSSYFSSPSDSSANDTAISETDDVDSSVPNIWSEYGPVISSATNRFWKMCLHFGWRLDGGEVIDCKLSLMCGVSTFDGAISSEEPTDDGTHPTILLQQYP